MRAKPAFFVLNGRLHHRLPGYVWTPQKDEEESARRMMHEDMSHDISLLEDGRFMVVTRDNPTKFYVDEDALRVALTLQGVRVDE